MNNFPWMRTSSCIALALSLAPVEAARAVDFVVNTLADENDGIGVGGVSLRDAINASNAGGSNNTITFSVAGTITLTADLPSITSNVSIESPLDTNDAASITIDGASSFRAFSVLGTATNLKIRFLNVSHCQAAGGAGGEAGNNLGGGGGGAAGMGAALFVNAGSVRVENVQFLGNSVLGGAGGANTAAMGFGAGGGGVGGAALSDGTGGGGGFLSGAGGGSGWPTLNSGGTGGDGAGGGGGGIDISMPLNVRGLAGGAGGFGGGGGGGGGFGGVGPGSGAAGGFGGGGGGAGSSNGIAGSGGMFGGNASGVYGGGGAGLAGAVFVRAGTVDFLGCTFKSNSATGGAAGGGNATGGMGKAGAIFVNAGALVGAHASSFGTGGDANHAADSAGTPSDNNDLFGAISTIPLVASVTRTDPSPTRAASVSYIVAFSEPVTDVDATDFALATTGVSGASVTDVSGAGAV